jgi:molybdopterin-guanine dinucleotide biosynthesis protein A
MDSIPGVSAYILAGGRSTRMGTDKAFVLLNGRTLLARMLEAARSLTSDVRIVGDPSKYKTFAPVLEDIFPGCGPLGGIHAALRSSNTDLNIILAVDTPFVSLPLLEFLISRARSSPAALVTVAQANGGLQPLCAVYRREFADAAEEALRAGHYKIGDLFDPAGTQVIGEEELGAAGFSPLIFRNLNTPDELAGPHE